MTPDFLAIGDTVVDEFIKLKEARVHCAINDSNCEICMRWGDKIPFEMSVLLAGVGNAANAAVAARRLGLATSLMATVGDDDDGKKVLAVFNTEGIDTSHILQASGKRTNHHYVLWYESERTILVRPEPYEYSFPPDCAVPKAVYLTSLGDAPVEYYNDIASFLESHPDIFLTFQPGTFQMKMGITPLTRIYARTNMLVVNKEEAERILGKAGSEISELIAGLMELGPKNVIITDNRNGAYAHINSETYLVPMYPDTREPVERTGAGDAFASTITAAVALGVSLTEALLWGPINSMSVVQKIGAQEGLLSRSEIESFLASAPASYSIQKI